MKIDLEKNIEFKKFLIFKETVLSLSSIELRNSERYISLLHNLADELEINKKSFSEARLLGLGVGKKNAALTKQFNSSMQIHDLDTYIIGHHDCLSAPADDLFMNL